MRGILAVGENEELATRVSVALGDAIVDWQLGHKVNDEVALVLPSTPAFLMNLLQYGDAEPLPDLFLRADEKLAMGFGPASNALLSRIMAELPDKKQDEMKNFHLFPLTQLMINYCHLHGVKRYWLHPDPTLPEFDLQIKQTLDNAGLTSCELNFDLERYLNKYVLRAGALYKVGDAYTHDVRDDVATFWNTLIPRLKQVGAQAVFLNMNSQVLLEYRYASTEHCPCLVIDPHQEYVRQIVQWANKIIL